MFLRLKNSPLILLIFGAICLGFSAIFVKKIGNVGMGLTAIAFWRMAIGGIILFTVTLSRGKAPLLPSKFIPWAALAGFFFTCDMSMWHRSIMITGAGFATLLGNTQVFDTAILSSIFFRERPTLGFFISIFTALSGVLLLSGVGSNVEFSDHYILGIILGLLAGLAYACYLIALRRVSSRDDKPDTMTFIAWICIFGSLFLGLGSTLEAGKFLPPSISVVTYLFGLALVVQVIGWWAVFSALSKIEAARVGLVLLIQPTVATILGYFIFREQLSLLQLAGGALTLASIYYGYKFRKK
jgi:drug/metabolite transporter (DMT)-like permease